MRARPKQHTGGQAVGQAVGHTVGQPVGQAVGQTVGPTVGQTAGQTVGRPPRVKSLNSLKRPGSEAPDTASTCSTEASAVDAVRQGVASERQGGAFEGAPTGSTCSSGISGATVAGGTVKSSKRAAKRTKRSARVGSE